MSPRTRKAVTSDPHEAPKTKRLQKKEEAPDTASTATPEQSAQKDGPMAAGAIDGLTLRIEALEAGATDGLRIEEGRQTSERLICGRVEKLEQSLAAAAAQVSALTTQLALPEHLATLQDDHERRLKRAEAELVQHKAFHSAHDPEALAEAARADTYKIWQVIAWGYPLLAALAGFALLRAI